MLNELQHLFPALRRVSLREKSFLARQLATMLDSGLPLAQAISILGVQVQNELLKEVLATIVHDLEHGYTFSGSIAKHPKVFNRVFVAAVKAGEASGKLDEVLTELAVQLEKDTESVAKIRGAMIYPVFILGAMGVVVVLMTTRIIPQLKTMFEENNADLPWTTNAVIAFAESFNAYWWIYFAAAGFLIWGLRVYLRTPEGREQWHRLKLRMPVLGKVNEGVAMARFARTLSMLIGAGVPIIEALRIVGGIIDNDIYERGIKEITNEVSRGVPISVPLQRNKNFPIIVSQMALVGEQTGKMDEVFKKLASYYESQTDELVKGLSSLLEPVVLVIIGIGVAFLVFSIIMPIYSLTQQIQ